MNFFRFLLPFLLVCFASCTSVKVVTDYDTKIDFSQYNTFAFYKAGIDKATISDLDKKRILRAIESELIAKGFTKSENPSLLVSIFAKSKEKVEISQNNNFGWGWGFGFHPWMNGNYNRTLVSQHTEGTLFIDFVDMKSKELIWQGVGSGVLRIENVVKKELRIQEFVKEIIAQYPPKSKQ